MPKDKATQPYANWLMRVKEHAAHVEAKISVVDADPDWRRTIGNEAVLETFSRSSRSQKGYLTGFWKCWARFFV